MDHDESEITEMFLENALKRYFKASEINIVKFEISNMTLPGENFGSNLLRILVQCSIDNCKETLEMSIVAKCFPTDEKMKVVISTMKAFDQEIQFYDELVPAFYNLDNHQKFCPDPIYVSLEPKPIILLEDLSEAGYRMANRELGLDLEHCRLVVEKLAYLHASSIAVYENDQNLIKKYNKGLGMEHEIMDSFTFLCYNSFIEAIERCPDLQCYVKKIKLLKESILQKLYGMNKSQNNILNVLNHGDFGIVNLLFLYTNEEKLNDVAFVDFQFPFYNSPAVDLYQFWTTSVATEVREKHLEDILKHYFERLLWNLSKLRVKITPPTYENFFGEFRSKAIYGFYSVLTRLQFVKVAKSEGATVFNFHESDCSEDSFRYRCYNNKSYLEELQYFLPLFDSFGLFN